MLTVRLCITYESVDPGIDYLDLDSILTFLYSRADISFERSSPKYTEILSVHIKLTKVANRAQIDADRTLSIKIKE